MSGRPSTYKPRIIDLLKKHGEMSIIGLATYFVKSKKESENKYKAVERVVKRLEAEGEVVTRILKREELAIAKRQDEWWFEYYDKFGMKPPTKVVIVKLTPPTPEEEGVFPEIISKKNLL